MRSAAYYKAKKTIVNVLIHVFLLSVAITCIFPLLWMVSSSLKTQQEIFKNMSLIPSGWHFENYYRAWLEGGFGRFFINSIIYTVAVVCGIIIIASLAVPNEIIYRIWRLFVEFHGPVCIPVTGIFYRNINVGYFGHFK